MSLARKPKDLVAFAVRNPDAENVEESNALGDRCEALDPVGIYSVRCQRAAKHSGKHWAKEYGLDGDGSVTSEWADS